MMTKHITHQRQLRKLIKILNILVYSFINDSYLLFRLSKISTFASVWSPHRTTVYWVIWYRKTWTHDEQTHTLYIYILKPDSQ